MDWFKLKGNDTIGPPNVSKSDKTIMNFRKWLNVGETGWIDRSVRRIRRKYKYNRDFHMVSNLDSGNMRMYVNLQKKTNSTSNF